jgi:hypothetical protein
MKPFACSTADCKGTVAPTLTGIRWAFGVLRVWLCPLCKRKYRLDADTPTVDGR